MKVQQTLSHWKFSGKIPEPFTASVILLYRIAYIDTCDGREHDTATLFISYILKPLCISLLFFYAVMVQTRRINVHNFKQCFPLFDFVFNCYVNEKTDFVLQLQL